MQHNFKGLGVAMVTPFTDKGEVDYAGLENLTNYLVEGGVDYLVVQGTTGESATMTLAEKQEVLRVVKQVNQGRKPVVFGHGGNNTASLVEGFSNFDLDGVYAILSASPYYNKPTQEGIYQHYKALSEASPLPIILYNVPGRTASNMSADTTLRLARDFDNIIAVKEASGDLVQIVKILKDKPEDFKVISGDDALVVPHIAAGGDGVISVIGNALPKDFGKMTHAALNGDYAEAQRIQNRVSDLIDQLFVQGNPAGIKAALKMKGVCGEAVRLPLVNISDDLRTAMEKELEGLN
ncbi:4-hydroxy-tetrahydrodipicolinate synthase [bacterium SCSIO 12741]|nr:4-hydroxy-tetrahydrodipicolinate synthase [bacterium SCSIO 12741]